MDPFFQSPQTQERRRKRVPRLKLPTQQRAVLDIIVRYYRGAEEPCPARHIARRLNISHVRVYEHIRTLHEKGWLVTSNAPSVPTRF